MKHERRYSIEDVSRVIQQPEGATTQPTPALISDVDVGCPACNGVNRHHPDCPDLAQPVPSAGSKPQEDEPDVELELSQAVRLELFLSHPCSGKYGDDGEMQCNQMPCFIDFKRDFPSEILAKSTIHRLLLNSLSQSQQSQPVADGGGTTFNLKHYEVKPDHWKMRISQFENGYKMSSDAFLEAYKARELDPGNLDFDEWASILSYAPKVADGGGLPHHKYQTTGSHKETELMRQLASSQEALRAPRERMQQAAPLFKRVMDSLFDIWDSDQDMKAGKWLRALTGALPGYSKDIDDLLSLLSPEGSSR